MNLNQLVEHFNRQIREAEMFLSPARSSRLQIQSSFALDVLSQHAAGLKQQAIRRNVEEDANLFLGFECVIGAVRSELLMWILLKKDKPDEAWDRLVAAEMACQDAARAHPGFEHCEQRLNGLRRLEREIFPKQVFASAGFVARQLTCSICGEQYSTCPHLRGRAYMGWFCEVVHRGIEADHVSLVETPADKRCRVVSFKTPEGHRNRLSWEVKAYGVDEKFEDDEYLVAEMIMLNADRYPYLASTSSILDVEHAPSSLNSDDNIAEP